MIFAWTAPLITCFWASYIDYHMYHSYERLKKRYFYLYPMVVNTVFIIINFFTPFIFSVSAENVYSREPFMWLIVVLNTTVVVYKWTDAFKHRDRINQEIVISMLAFILLPALAAGIQVLVFGAFIMWPVMSITIVVSYLYLETISTARDYLTKLMSRHRIDDHVDYLINTQKEFGLGIIDLNGFKRINDNYGHHNGDRALQIFARALRNNFLYGSIIGRYGGDEFIIITKPMDDKEIKLCCYRLTKEVEKIVAKEGLPFNIGYSFGYQAWQKEDNYSYEELFALADKKMYEEKQMYEENQISEDRKMLEDKQIPKI